MPKGKMSSEEWTKRKVALAAEPGTFVVRGNTLESRWLLSRIREYDRLLGWVKSHIGVDIDTQKALDVIDKCKTIEDEFRENLRALREFVRSYQNKTDGRGNGGGSQGVSQEEMEETVSFSFPTATVEETVSESQEKKTSKK